MKGVQCYELFGGIALKIHTFSFFFSILETWTFRKSNLLDIFFFGNLQRNNTNIIIAIAFITIININTRLEKCMYVAYHVPSKDIVQ